PAGTRRDAVRVGDQHDPGLHPDQPLPAPLRDRWIRLRLDLRAHRPAGPRPCPASAGGSPDPGAAALTMYLPIPPRTAGGRSRRTRRSSPAISRTRLLAAIGVGLVTVALYLVSVESVFAVDPARVSISGASYVDTQQIRQDLQLAPAGGDTTAARNLF